MLTAFPHHVFDMPGSKGIPKHPDELGRHPLLVVGLVAQYQQQTGAEGGAAGKQEAADMGTGVDGIMVPGVQGDLGDN